MFGGGLSLAAAIETSGLAVWLGDQFMNFRDWPVIVIILAIVILTIILSELASNTATAAMLLPITGAIAAGLQLPAAALTVPVALAASCGVMLPIATPPNALFYASGCFSVADLARAGAAVDVAGALLVTFLGFALAHLLL